jgi:hypothetical protein
MVLTAAQVTIFFEDANGMAIPNATVLQLVAEGINNVDDLSEFDKDTIQQIASNLRRPPAGAHYVFGAKSQKRLTAACDIVRYYETIGRTITAANLVWNTVIKNFEIQWKALQDKKKGDEPETPKIAKGLNIMKWSESFRDILHRCIGVRMIPLAYVIRELEVPPAITALAAGQPHSATAGSIEMELIHRGSHNHPLFRDDRATVYYKLEEATRGTSYAASIKPFQRTKDGRGAFDAIINQYAGEDKWESEIKTKEALLHGIQWKGQSNYSLERHAAQHRNAYVSLVACAEHVAYQLPNEHSRVGYLLDSIQNNDPGLQAAMANVRSSKGVGGMRSNFESMVAHILPYCPVAKKKTTGSKRGAGEISTVDGDKNDGNVSSFGVKSGRGPKTGVHLRYHKHSEYQKLSEDEQTELREWRTTTQGAGKGKHTKEKLGGKRVKYDEKSIAAVVDKKIDAKLKAAQDTQSQTAEAEAFIASCLHKFANGDLAMPAQKKPSIAATTSSAKASNTQILNSILGRAKNASKKG